MLDVGWSEMLVIAIVMIVVVGPKDLPQMLRTIGRMMTKMRGMANDFQKQFNEALKEAELDDVKKSVDSLRSLNPAAEIRKQLNPFEKAGADLRAGIDSAMKPKPAASATQAEMPATVETEAKPGEPLKGAAAIPGGPEAMPAPPTFPAMTDASATASVSAAAPKAKRVAKPAKPAKAATAASAKAAPAKASVPAPAKVDVAPKAAQKPALTKAASPAAAKAAPARATAPAKTAAKAAQPARKPARAPK